MTIKGEGLAFNPRIRANTLIESLKAGDLAAVRSIAAEGFFPDSSLSPSGSWVFDAAKVSGRDGVEALCDIFPMLAHLDFPWGRFLPRRLSSQADVDAMLVSLDFSGERQGTGFPRLDQLLLAMGFGPAKPDTDRTTPPSRWESLVLDASISRNPKHKIKFTGFASMWASFARHGRGYQQNIPATLAMDLLRMSDFSLIGDGDFIILSDFLSNSVRNGLVGHGDAMTFISSRESPWGNLPDFSFAGIAHSENGGEAKKTVDMLDDIVNMIRWSIRSRDTKPHHLALAISSLDPSHLAEAISSCPPGELSVSFPILAPHPDHVALKSAAVSKLKGSVVACHEARRLGNMLSHMSIEFPEASTAFGLDDGQLVRIPDTAATATMSLSPVPIIMRAAGSGRLSAEMLMSVVGSGFDLCHGLRQAAEVFGIRPGKDVAMGIKPYVEAMTLADEIGVTSANAPPRRI